MQAPFLDSYVTLDPVPHKYFDKDGKEYGSWSKFIKCFEKPFDPNLAYACAGKTGYEGMAGEEVLKKWSDYADERGGIGTDIHDACELFEKTGTVLPKNEKWRPGLISITSEYKDYYKLYQEQTLYSEEDMLAGTADKLCVTSQYHDAVIDITDYKTNVGGVQHKDFDKHGKPKHQYFLGPLSHLLCCKYNRYGLQLSMYAYMLEKKTGRRIGSLRIHEIDSDNLLRHRMLTVPYMKLEILATLRWKKERDLLLKEETINLGY